MLGCNKKVKKYFHEYLKNDQRNLFLTYIYNQMKKCYPVVEEDMKDYNKKRLNQIKSNLHSKKHTKSE